MSRKLPDTSIEAWKSVHKNMKDDHWGRILATMRLLNKPASMEQIAECLKWDTNRVSRRMAELELDNLVVKDGKGKTKSGRSCYLYKLVSHGEIQPRQPKSETEKQSLVQKELFQ